jgi:tetratricopeptide (TPR) repeat protein
MLLKTVDACLAGVIFVAPLVLGGRHDVGRLVFAVLAGLASTAWFVRQAIVSHSAGAPHTVLAVIGGASLTLVVQLWPLPADWIAWLSPRTHELLPLWSGAASPGGLGEWSTLSLAPEATRLSLAMLAAYALLFLTVYQRAQNEIDVIRLVRWVGLSAGLMAMVGLVQFAMPNGKFLWIYEHPSRDATQRLSGAFANCNHFAHFLAIGVPALAVGLTLRLQISSIASPFRLPPLGGEVWGGEMRLAHGSAFGSASALPIPPHQGEGTGIGNRPPRQRERGGSSMTSQADRWITIGAAALLVIAAAAVFLSCSRGGALALATSASVVGACLYRAGLLSGSRLAVLAAAMGTVFLAISLVGYEQVAARLATLTARTLEDVDKRAGRRKIWQANLAAIKAGGPLGSGAGTHAEIYPVYMSDPPIVQYTHAESGYLQIVTENGVPGAVLLAAALVLAASWSGRALSHARSPEVFAYSGACAAALAASAVHAIVDFAWFVPACMSVTLVLAACVLRLGTLSRERREDVADKATAATDWSALPWAVGAALAAAFAIGQLMAPAAAASHWDAYLRTAVAHRGYSTRLAAMKPDEWLARRPESFEAELASFTTMIDALERVAQRRPDYAPAHRQLANRYVQLFNLQQERADNSMPLSQIRDCAVQSPFASAAEVHAWLERAFGPRVAMLYRARAHAQRAAQLSPLEGEPYIRLAELCFLDRQTFAEADRLLQQATLVRPYDGDLLFDVGSQWAARGVDQWALECWRRAFFIAGPHRLKIIRTVAGELPTTDVIRLLAPHWDTLPELWRICREKSPAEAPLLIAYGEEEAGREVAAADPSRAAAVWRALAEMQREAGLGAAALASLERSCQAAPEDYATRRLLGLAYYEANRFDEGDQHLRWCLDRRPQDAAIKAAILRTSRERYARQQMTTR